MNRRVFVTGISGFVGRHVVSELVRSGVAEIRGCGRGPVEASLQPMIARWAQLDLSSPVNLAEHLKGCDSIIHLAGRAHVMRETVQDSLAEYRRVNVEGTRHIAQAAKQAGVKRFVYLSSIKVNGERTYAQPFRSDDRPHPEDAYGISKLEAEDVLSEELRDSSVRYVVLRPPLIYGPGVRANFLALIKAVHRGVPLPLGSVANRRSMIHVANVSSAVMAGLLVETGSSGRYVISDDEALSIADIIRNLADGLEVEPRLLQVSSVGMKVLETMLAAVGKKAMLQRLTQDLQIDNSKFKRDFNWVPQVSTPVGLRETGAWYIRQLSV